MLLSGRNSRSCQTHCDFFFCLIDQFTINMVLFSPALDPSLFLFCLFFCFYSNLILSHSSYGVIITTLAPPLSFLSVYPSVIHTNMHVHTHTHAHTLHLSHTHQLPSSIGVIINPTASLTEQSSPFR